MKKDSTTIILSPEQKIMFEKYMDDSERNHTTQKVFARTLEKAKRNKAMQRQTKKICKSKKTARKYLQKIGIYGKDGNLTKNYGG